jgi:protein-disulfide isomerase
VPHDGPIDKSFSVTAAPELTKKAAEKDDDDDEDEEEEEEEVQHPDFLAHFSTFPSVIQVRKRRATRLAGHFLGCSSSFSPLITNFEFFEYISPACTEISLGGRR